MQPRVSAQNCANVYNNGIGQPAPHTLQLLQSVIPAHASASLSSEQVWHAFFLYSLLWDVAKCSQQLVILHSREHNDQLKYMMEQHNLHILGQGQWEKMHACDICCKFIPGSGFNGLGKQNWCTWEHYWLVNCLESSCAVTANGHYMGWPCCKEHNCPHPLITNQHHFCPGH